MSEATREAITRVWKNEAARLICGLVRIVRDVSLAEELAQDALVVALEQWPQVGVPDKPGAWLMTTARNRALNQLRRAKLADRVGETLAHETAPLPEPLMNELDDDVLRLIFTACHPILPTEARVALTLRLIGGLTTEEIARAFLSAEPTIAQRIVRAKRTLSDAGVSFEVPSGADLAPRLASVLEVVYLIFNEGYSATAGDDLMRPQLTTEAIRLGRLLANLAPAEPEVHGLIALMCFHASRSTTRVDEAGDPVLLADQDRSRWDRALIDAGRNALARADALTQTRGAYHLQAAIAACHAMAPSVAATEWAQIAELYRELGTVAPSPVIELNRAMAVSRAQSPAAALVILDKLRREPALARYHLLPAARAELLEQLGRFEEARAEFERAAALAGNARQRERLTARAAACTSRTRS